MRAILGLGFMVCALLPASARADLVLGAVGDPYDGGSWFQGFRLTSSTAFDRLGLAMISFDGTSGFADPSWDFDTIDGNPHEFSEILHVGDKVTVAGTNAGTTNLLTWTNHLEGDGTLPGENDGQNFILTFFAWSSDFNPASLQRGAAHWDGTEWNFLTGGGVSWEEFGELAGSGGSGVIPTMPVPSAVMLGMFGLALTGGLVRRLKD